MCNCCPPHTLHTHTPHTHRYDVPSAIPDGSIQRAGENVVAILREVAISEQLANPSEEDTHGKVRHNGLSKIAFQTPENWEKRSLLFMYILMIGTATLMDSKTSQTILIYANVKF